MKDRAKKICNWSWCNETCYGSYCDKHKEAAAKRAKPRYTPASSIYKTEKWQAFRKVILARDILCRICKRAKSIHVDHIVAIKDGGEPFDENNAQGLCKPCHSRKTALYDGRWAKKTY